MDRLHIDYYYRLGRMMALLESAVSLPGPLSAADLSHVATAKDWLVYLSSEENTVNPRCKKTAKKLLETISPILDGTVAHMSAGLAEELLSLIAKFHHELESESDELYIYFVSARGAYSTPALVENAVLHLSATAQNVIDGKQKEDFKLAGKSLAYGLFTASGFHAMRTLEAEVRIYHKIVTGVELNESPLGALINGDNRAPGSGLSKEHVKEGGKSDSNLGLIISLLLHINKIYRCPIMHPEMTLRYETAKQVFDLAATAVSLIVADGVARIDAKTKASAAITTPGAP